MTKKKPFFIFTYGIPGSGKSTISNFIKKTNKMPISLIKFPEDTNFEIINVDAYRRKVYEKKYKKPLEEIFKGILNPKIEKIVWNIVENKLIENAINNRDTILDSLLLEKAYRIRLLNKIRKNNDNIFFFLLIVDCPLELALIRNKRRSLVVPEPILKEMYKIRNDINEQPNIFTEKWDFIYIFKSNNYCII